MAVCANCGLDNDDDARYCDSCGVELGKQESPDTHPDTAVEDR